MAKQKKKGGEGGKKKGKKGKKGTGIKIISYFEKPRRPLFTGPYQFQGKAGEDALQEFEKTATAIREKFSFDKENTYVCFRVRQIEIQSHDFFVTLPKTATLYHLQLEISKRQHLGSVLASHVAIFKPSPTLEKNAMFGSSMAITNLNIQEKMDKTVVVVTKKKTGFSSENLLGIGLNDNMPKKQTAVDLAPTIDEESDNESKNAPARFEYFKDNTATLLYCFPSVSKYAGGKYNFEYNPKGPSLQIVPPPEPERPKEEEPPKPKKSTKKDKKTKEGKDDIKKDDKKKKKKAAPKKVPEKPKLLPPAPPQYILAPTPISIYYDVLTYTNTPGVLTSGQEFHAKKPLATSDAQMNKTFVPIAISELPSTPRRNFLLNNNSLDIRCPLLVMPIASKSSVLFGNSPATLAERANRPRTNASSMDISRSFVAPFDSRVATLQPQEKQQRLTQSASLSASALPPMQPKQRPKTANLASDGNRKITPLPFKRPGTAGSTATTFATTRVGSAASYLSTSSQQVSSIAKSPTSIPWDKRWMMSQRNTFGAYEWEKMMKRCDPHIDNDDWTSDEEATVVDDEGLEESPWAWRLREGYSILSAASMARRFEIQKRIDEVVPVVDDKQGKKKGAAINKGKKKK